MAAPVSDARANGASGDPALWLGDSDMARMVLAFDWSRTSAGPIASWSRSLRSAVTICLRSRFQMAIYWGADLNFIYNDAEREVIGDLHPRALGLPARELMHGAWDIVGPQLQAVMSGGETTLSRDEPLRFDRRGRPEVVYFTWSYSPLLDDDGTIGGVLLVSQDTTSRVLAERRIEVLRELVAGSMDAFSSAEACELAARSVTRGPDVPFALIYLLEADGARASRAATSVPEGMRPTLRAVVELNRPGDEVAAIFRGVLNGRSDVRLTDAHRFVRADQRAIGVPRQAFVAGIGRGTNERVDGFMIAGVLDDVVFDDSYQGFLEMAAHGVGRSVAAARAREADRQRAESIAALDSAKTALFSNASHELRTPLALILGHLDELLDDPGVAPPARTSARMAHRGALRMLKLVNALLDFSRIEAGEQVTVVQATDIARLTRDITAMFQSTVERAGLRLTVDCSQLPALVDVDPDAWERMVSNLISNAVKFTPEGAIHVACHAAGAQLRLTVEDTGIGIPPEDLERIFSRFYRSSDPRARTHEGSGIGLALVRELVQLHGGAIEAESRPEEGTRMIVTLPLSTCRVDDTDSERGGFSANVGRSTALFVAEAEGWLGEEGSDVADDYLRPTAAHGVAVGSGSEAAPSVLVAEDNSDMLAYLRRLLAPDFRVILARDGNEARRLALRHLPDLVISDAMMPGLDGFALIRELRRDSRTADVPVIIVSARADPESTLEALKLGADDYIVKPFGARELRVRIHAILLNSQARISAGAARGRNEERTRSERELRSLLNDLRAAQRRVVVAGDAARRRIEGNLHDGAQQRLTAVRIGLELVREGLEGDPQAAERRLDALLRDLDEALEELRELAHGLYPSLLVTEGLHAALSVAARRAAIPVSVQAGNLKRAPRSIESAVYFCCVEAVQNATKHAGAGARASIRLDLSDGMLEFEVRDDGIGFDPRAVPPGYGLINLRDRLEALGGQSDVSSVPGSGTTVVGRIPLP